MNLPNTGDEEDDTCPICLTDYSDPVITDCFHKFCNKCITKSILTSGSRCPVCRKDPCQIAVRIQNDEFSPKLELCDADYLCDRCFVKIFCSKEENGTRISGCLLCSGSDSSRNVVPRRNRVSPNSVKTVRLRYIVQEITSRTRSRNPPYTARIATDEARIHYSPESSPFESGGGGHPVVDRNSVGQRSIRIPEESVFMDDGDELDVKWMEGEPYVVFEGALVSAGDFGIPIFNAL